MKRNTVLIVLAALFLGVGYFVMQDGSPPAAEQGLGKAFVQNISPPPPPEIPDDGSLEKSGVQDKEQRISADPIVVEEIGCRDYACFKKHYTTLVQEQELTVVFADIKTRYETTPFVKAFCHPLVHVIGRTAQEKYSSAGKAFEQGDHFCSSGYFHGVTEGILRSIGPADVPEAINAVCEDVSGKETYSLLYYNCVHGLGHGTMFVTENELFAALDLCDNLEGSWQRESCWGGVFMENIIADLEQEGYHSTQYVRPEDPLYPCNAVEEKYKPACYLNQTSYMAKVVNYDFAKIFDLCDQAEAS